MKLISVIVIGLLGFGTVACQEKKMEKSDLKTQKDKVSYSIGLDIGKKLRQQSIEVEPTALLEGLKDGLFKDSLFLLTDQEIQQTMMAFQQEMMAKHNEKMKELGEKNKKDGEKFLEENKKKEGVKVLPSGLQYKVLRTGDGPSPKLTDKITAHYRGTLIDGVEFDNSYRRGEPATFPVNGVIKGWSEALQLMKVGDKWELYIPPNLAYGETGAGDLIGPNAVLIFEVELLSIGDKK